MAQMVVDIGAMRRALAEVTTAGADARVALNSVERLAGTLPGVWAGTAAERYLATVTEWCNQYRRVVNALDMLRDGLRSSMVTLEQAEISAQSQSV